jgi:hypothetical protein
LCGYFPAGLCGAFFGGSTRTVVVLTNLPLAKNCTVVVPAGSAPVTI